MSDHIECGIDGCTERSRYLLTCGNRCPEHAKEAQPTTVGYINWAVKGVENDTDDNPNRKHTTGTIDGHPFSLRIDGDAPAGLVANIESALADVKAERENDE